MKTLLVLLTAFCVSALAVPVEGIVLDQVDIGDPLSEADHDLAGWGHTKHGTRHDPPGPYGDVDNCRGIDCPEALGDGNNWAWVVLDFGPCEPGLPKCITLRHLEGQAIDAFELYLYEIGDVPPGVLVFSYPGDVENTDLVWHSTTVEVCAAGPCVLHFVSTGEHWAGWETYGQMYFDWIVVQDNCQTSVRECSWTRLKALFR
jgi:hypothetical protein